MRSLIGRGNGRAARARSSTKTYDSCFSAARNRGDRACKQEIGAHTLESLAGRARNIRYLDARQPGTWEVSAYFQLPSDWLPCKATRTKPKQVTLQISNHTTTSAEVSIVPRARCQAPIRSGARTAQHLRDRGFTRHMTRDARIRRPTILLLISMGSIQIPALHEGDLGGRTSGSFELSEAPEFGDGYESVNTQVGGLHTSTQQWPHRALDVHFLIFAVLCYYPEEDGTSNFGESWSRGLRFGACVMSSRTARRDRGVYGSATRCHASVRSGFDFSCTQVTGC